MMGRNTHKNVNKIKVVERKLVTGKSKQTKLPIMGKNVTGKNARKNKSRWIESWLSYRLFFYPQREIILHVKCKYDESR